MQSVLLPALVVAVVAVTAASKLYARRRISRLKVAGGRMSLVLNLVNERNR